MMTLREYRLLLVDRFLRWRYRQQDQSTGINYSDGSAIIMFHHVGISKPKGVSASCFSTIDDFNSLIDTLLKSKQIVSLGTLVREIKSGVVPKNHIVLTFDDVPYDFFSNAAPILHKKQIPYTLYVATSLIDTDGYLTTDQLRQLSRNPLCTVGSHTVNHVKVREKGVDFKRLEDYTFRIDRKRSRALCVPVWNSVCGFFKTSKPNEGIAIIY